jgi:hypothetical protein
MKKILIILSFFFLANVGCTVSDPEMMELLQEIKDQNDKLLKEVEAMKGQLSLLDGKYQVILASLADNKKEIEALKSQIDSLKGQIAQQLIKIDQLSVQLTKQGADIIKLSAEIAELKASCEELKGLIEQLLSDKSPVPTNDLIAWFPFNGNADDESGNGYNAAINGPALTSDRFLNANKSLAFDGINDWVQLTKKLPDLTSFSISVWVYHTKDSRSGIFSDATTDSANDLFFNVSNNEIGIMADKQNTELKRLVIPGTLTATPAFQTTNNLNGTWNHVVWVLTPNVSYLYLNGTLVSTINSKGSNVGFHAPNGASIGRLTDNTSSIYPTQYFQGKIDDFALWGRALSANEITKIYKGEKF